MPATPAITMLRTFQLVFRQFLPRRLGLSNGELVGLHHLDKGFVPTNCNDVTIPSGVTVTVDIANAQAQSLTINNAGAATGLTISGSYQLTVTNAVTCNAPSIAGTSTIGIGGGTLSVGGTLTLNGGAASKICQVTWARGLSP